MTSFNPTEEFIFEAIVPSDIDVGASLPTATPRKSLCGRVRLPNPGNIESCGLVRPYVMSNGQFKRELGNHKDFRTVSTKEKRRVMEVEPGLSVAYQLSERATIGKIELKKPMDLSWELGQQDDGFVISTIRLKDKSYVRIFPILESERAKIKSIYRWPFYRSVHGFNRIPELGSTSKCLVLWTMAKDGRPVGHAFPV